MDTSQKEVGKDFTNDGCEDGKREKKKKCVEEEKIGRSVMKARVWRKRDKNRMRGEEEEMACGKRSEAQLKHMKERGNGDRRFNAGDVDTSMTG